MASLATTLGLCAPSLPNSTTLNYAPAFVSFHFIFAYVVLAPRHLKQIYGIDHNVSPREDLAKYGDAAVKSGKITQKQLEMMRRNESTQANAVENYILLVGAMGFATFAGVERELGWEQVESDLRDVVKETRSRALEKTPLIHKLEKMHHIETNVEFSDSTRHKDSSFAKP